MAHIDDTILIGMTADQRLRLWVLDHYHFEYAQRVYDFIMAGAAKQQDGWNNESGIAYQQRGVLARAGIVSLADLTKRTRESVSNIRYIGPKTIDTLDRMLNEAGMDWANITTTTK